MDKIPNSSLEEGRLTFLSGISLDAEKQEIAAFIHNQGFNSKHQGYCIVEFLLSSEAQEAIKRLPDNASKGKHLKTAIPQRRKQPSFQSIATNLPVEAKAIPNEVEAITNAAEFAFESRRVEPPSSTFPRHNKHQWRKSVLDVRSTRERSEKPYKSWSTPTRTFAPSTGPRATSAPDDPKQDTL
ncbi:hypothetical protein Forpe1208_v014979 [Fusarium oxysporum f. sp. rapae]|uniref:RRM domain-containing protein n=1 Tax=Fusarium oxysporum f. sp. rapae TaxID=485398 RepID=A0A8J5TYP3_FUSOX|nr:hypothetical protein Forpe1208_v014979 [Fusarium oxysporum f. sp. rapae]